MKKIKFVFMFLPMLICIAIFSIGFASWSVLPSSGGSMGVSVTVDDVYYSTDYVTVNSIDVSDYTTLHFLDSGAASDEGYITVTCQIDLDACYNRMISKGKTWDGTLSLSVALFYSNVLDGGTSLFSDVDDGTYYKKVTAIVDGVNASSCNLVNNGAIVEANAELTGLSSTGKCTFDMKFVLNIPEKLKDTDTPANFRYLFGQYLKNTQDDKTVFISSARVVDVE